MRAQLARWRRQQRRAGETGEFGDYVRHVWSKHAQETTAQKSEPDLTSGRELLMRLESINMRLESEEGFDRRKVLANYKVKKPISSPVKTPEPELIQTPPNVGATVTIKRSESKLTKKNKGNRLSDYGLTEADVAEIMAGVEKLQAGPKKPEPEYTVSPATQAVVDEIINQPEKVKSSPVGEFDPALEAEVMEMVNFYTKPKLAKPIEPEDFGISPNTVDEMTRMVEQYAPKPAVQSAVQPAVGSMPTPTLPEKQLSTVLADRFNDDSLEESLIPPMTPCPNEDSFCLNEVSLNEPTINMNSPEHTVPLRFGAAKRNGNFRSPMTILTQDYNIKSVSEEDCNKLPSYLRLDSDIHVSTFLFIFLNFNFFCCMFLKF